MAMSWWNGKGAVGRKSPGPFGHYSPCHGAADALLCPVPLLRSRAGISVQVCVLGREKFSGFSRNYVLTVPLSKKRKVISS